MAEIQRVVCVCTSSMTDTKKRKEKEKEKKKQRKVSNLPGGAKTDVSDVHTASLYCPWPVLSVRTKKKWNDKTPWKNEGSLANGLKKKVSHFSSVFLEKKIAFFLT